MFDPSQYQQSVQQAQRHEIARMQQRIFENERHVAELHQVVTYLGQNIQTEKESIEYATLLLELNKTKSSLVLHYQKLSQMIQLANITFSKTIPEQCKREIYHFYHAGRYNQAQLAGMYNVSQSAVSKIINGKPPAPIEGVNPNGITS